MTKRISKSLLMRILIAVCVFAFALSAVFVVIAQTKADSKVDLEPEYFVGETFELPSSTVTVNESEVPATAVLYYPSGKATTANKVTFDEVGKYTLEYRATVGGELFTETYDLIVNQKAYDGGIGASAVYDSDYQGIKATFGNAGVLKFNKRFDLSKLTSKDNLIKFLPLPETKGEADAVCIVFTFTDVYDSDNFISIRFREGTISGAAFGKSLTYVAVSYPGAPYTGFDGGAIHKGDNYGRPIYMSFYGVPGYETRPEIANIVTLDYGKVQFDYNSRIMSANSDVSTAYGGTVAEFDSKAYFANTWAGFTTGEVYASVKLETLGSSATNASFLIKEIAGEELSEATSITDTIAPEISVDFGDYQENNLPYGIKNCEYKVFEASVKDNIDFNPEIKVNVYKNYFTPALRKTFPVTNGTFKPDSAGNYVIEYKAIDVYGNVSTKAVAVTVSDQPSEIVIEADAIQDAIQGEQFSIPTANVSGDVRYGEIEIDTKLYFGDKEITVNDGKYIPLNAGEYKVVYTATYYAGGVKVVEKPFTVAENDGSVFLEDVANLLPKFFIDRNVYTLPSLDACVFENGQYQKIESTITVNGQQVNGNQYVANVENSGDVLTVTYSYQDLETHYQVKGIKAIDSEYNLHMSEYFVANGDVSVQATEDEIKLDYLDGNASVDFANAVFFKDLSVVFSADSVKNNFNKVVFTLTDVVNSDKQVKISIGKDTDVYAGLSVNGGAEEQVDGAFNGKRVMFDVVDGTSVKMVKSSGVVTSPINYSISTYTDGTTFTGFTNNMVYLTVSIEGKTGDSVVNMVVINGNYLNNSNVDPAKPKIQTGGVLAYDQEKGATVTIPSAIGIDVIQGSLPVTVSVRFNGQYMKDITGKQLKDVDASVDYQVIFTEYGEYSIVYKSEDLYGNQGTNTKKVKVFDDIAPTITLDEEIDDSAKVGKIEIPTATASDNIAGEFTVYAIVILPSGSYEFIVDNTFTASVAGKYVVRYFTYDTAGNMGVAEYVINVK